MASPLTAFRAVPATNTVSIAAGTSTGNVATPANVEPLHRAGGAGQIRLYNSGAVPVFVNFGADNTVTAVVPSGATPGDMPIAPGAVEVVSPTRGPSYVAAITASGSATLYITPGDGL